MNTKFYLHKCLLLCLAGLCFTSLHAAPREAGKGDNGAVVKLQAMVKTLTNERDAAKTDLEKMHAEIDQLKAENAKSSKNIETADAALVKLDGELAAQKASSDEVRGRLDKTTGMYNELIQKYKELLKAKSDLSAEYTGLQNKNQATVEQLQTCTEQNVKLFESGKDLLSQYENKGRISTLLQDEPLLQFKSVEMENTVQEYEDKLRSGIYKKSPATVSGEGAVENPNPAPAEAR